MGEIRRFIGDYPLHSLAFGLVAAFEISKITERVPGVGGLGTGIQPNRPPVHPSLLSDSETVSPEVEEHIAIDRHLRPPTPSGPFQPKAKIDRHLRLPPKRRSVPVDRHLRPPTRARPVPPSRPLRTRSKPLRTRSSSLGMTTSTSTTTSSSHIPGLMAASTGETSMPMETNALYGVPNTVRRRVLYGDMPSTPTDNIAKESALITANSAKQRKEHSDIVSMQGVFAPVGGYGWV
jgi:hypothetical protein